MNQQLEPRILKNIQAEFERATFSGKNCSGIKPIGTSVLVLMDQCAETSSGGVLLPGDKIAQMNMASESGVIAAVGDAAFSYYDDGRPWKDQKPAPGDRVFVERYAGREILGRDGKVYRLMGYTCVGGLEEPAEIAAPKSPKKRVTKETKG